MYSPFFEKDVIKNHQCVKEAVVIQIWQLHDVKTLWGVTHLLLFQANQQD